MCSVWYTVHERAVVFQFNLFFFPVISKEEIETKHFEHTFAVPRTNRAAELPLTKLAEVLCVSPQPLFPMGFYRVMSVTFLFLFFFDGFLLQKVENTYCFS